MSNTETDTIAEEQALSPIRAGVLARWIEQDPELAVKRIEAMERIVETLRAAAIRATYPSDWVIHVSRDQDGAIIAQRGYLQDIGVDRAGTLWGIEVAEPLIEREPRTGVDEDGFYAYRLIADAWSKVTGARVEGVIGARSSGDPFFRRGKDPDDKVDPTDVLKAAYANLHGRAGRALMGLGGVDLDTLERGGIDVKRVVMVDYVKGGKGGESTGAAVGTADVVMAFGKQKGMKAADLADADLAWYIAAAEKSLADPSKANFHKAEQRRLDALKRVQEERARKTEHEAATGKEEPATTTNGAGRITAQEVTEAWTLANRNGWKKDDVSLLLQEVGATMMDQVPMSAWPNVKDVLSKPPTVKAT